ncbi:adenylate kinase isoenzyme 5 isoform X1 [Microplitis mediator]|uniref:adenylate kinase isoenzyme 5 isoform X1 n=1 Tax=Microplitis mediator TaxID=375433 RepID=UPI00255670DE|nr:adenylate kinase isoenzyme 5 isoform X1 [Microplitis mediator]
MGICLDTDQQNGSQVFEDSNAQSVGKWRGEAGLLSTPPNGRFPTQNIGPVKFEPPTVPVIFVLGGPGSGKVTHCDNLIQEKKGITHINMTDLLQQYAIGNDMQDFGLLSSKTVAEVLMLEMKMSPNAKTFLISGYPRNMRDVVEYSEKIQVINGVVLVSWRQEVLERQIDYGAQLGHVILSLARMELKNFFRNVMPVAEYFDRSGMLIEVNGERNPSEVYVDFREAIIQILGSPESVLRDRTHQPLEAEVKVEHTYPTSGNSNHIAPPSPTTRINPAKTANKARKGLPSFIWVIGGPGSNKSNLCTQAIRNMPNWAHISIGNLFRAMASSNAVVNDSIVAGEMVAQDIVMQLVEQQVLLNRDNDGIVIDGFPRDLNQVQEFESKFGQKPSLVLLDCSKLQLGRGKLDDSVPAFRKRLEVFREITLPMLKTLDNNNRLITIDGDTDVPSVQQEFEASLYQLMRQVRRKEEDNIQRFATSTPVDNDDDNNPSIITSDNTNSNHVKTEMTNGRPKNVIENGINTMSNHVNKQKTNNSFQVNKITNGINHRGVKKEIGTKIRDAVDESARITNDVLKSSRKNGNHGHLNGAANGASRLFQNGIGHLANGIPPGVNRIAPAPTNSVNHKNSIKKKHNGINGFHENLHI